jgi:FMN-dependent NADH-azoreductase
MRNMQRSGAQAILTKNGRLGDAAEAEKFKSYDKYIFSVPMWKRGVPFILKKYIDTITQPGLLSDWSPATGYVGLLDKPVVAIYSSSFDYGKESAMANMDYRKRYFEQWLRVISCANIQSIVVAPTSAMLPELAPAREKAIEKARAIARTF